MRNIKLLCVAIFAVVAFATVAVASASAEEFVSSEEGALTGKQTNNQIFTVESGGTEVVCTIAKTTGTVKELKAHSQVVSVQYEKCTVGGIFEATITLAEYLFMAEENGELSVHILNTESKPIEISVPVAGCTIKVWLNGNDALKSITFKQNGKNLIEESNVTGITSDVSGGGGLCGAEGSKTTGTYTGNNEVELNEGKGTIEVK